MPTRVPLAFERLDDYLQLEDRGVFRVLHDEVEQPDTTVDKPLLQELELQSERPLGWLWQDTIPLGKLTLIEGPPAVGKLFVALDIAARESSGVEFGEDDSVSRDGRPVVVICDGWQSLDMIAERLRLLGADLGKIITFTSVVTSDECGGHRHRRPIRFPLDLQMFEYIKLKNRGCRLIVIDNLEHYCDSPRQLRQAIQEIDSMAVYLGIAIVATLQGNVRFTADGTIRDTARTIDGLARCIWSLTPDAARPGLLRFEPKRMAFSKKPEGIACRISDAGEIVWEELPPYEQPPTAASLRKARERARMRAWLETTLGTAVVLSDTIYDDGREQGFSQKALIAARDEMGGRSFKIGFSKKGKWLWTMKAAAEVTKADVKDALAGMPNELSFKSVSESPEPLTADPPAAGGEGSRQTASRPEDERETAVAGLEQTGREDVSEVAQKSENFGVLSKNGREIELTAAFGMAWEELDRFQDLINCDGGMLETSATDSGVGL